MFVRSWKIWWVIRSCQQFPRFMFATRRICRGKNNDRGADSFMPTKRPSQPLRYFPFVHFPFGIYCIRSGRNEEENVLYEVGQDSLPPIFGRQYARAVYPAQYKCTYYNLELRESTSHYTRLLLRFLLFLRAGTWFWNVSYGPGENNVLFDWSWRYLSTMGQSFSCLFPLPFVKIYIYIYMYKSIEYRRRRRQYSFLDS